MMQTFLPYPKFAKTAQCLDNRRLGKQRVEAWQIYKALTDPKYDWKNHPIVKMWKDCEMMLCIYGKAICIEWKRRGYKDNMLIKFESALRNTIAPYDEPDWLDDEELHRSHQSNLVRKYPDHYKKFFPDVPDDLPYKWVVKKS